MQEMVWIVRGVLNTIQVWIRNRTHTMCDMISQGRSWRWIGMDSLLRPDNIGLTSRCNKPVTYTNKASIVNDEISQGEFTETELNKIQVRDLTSA